MKETKSRSRIKVFAVAFGLFVVLFTVLYSLLGALWLVTSGSIIVGQYARYHELCGHHELSDGGLLPPELPLVRTDENEYYMQDIDAYYYPNAWDKAGHILLKRRWGNTYYLVLGDGTTATVTCWHNRDPNVEPNVLSPTCAERHNYVNLWVIPLAGVSIATALLLVKKPENKVSGDITSPGKGLQEEHPRQH